VALLEFKVTEPPVANVVGPPGVIVGFAGIALMVTFADFESLQLAAVVTVAFSIRVPAAPAV
jgi:hypothetical protein